jgi:hypothetical protein
MEDQEDLFEEKKLNESGLDDLEDSRSMKNIKKSEQDQILKK